SRKARRRAAPPRVAREGHRRGVESARRARRAAGRQERPPRRARASGRVLTSQSLRRHAAGAGRRRASHMSDVFPLGEVPKNVGELPKKMLAWVIRPDREGDPETAMKLEEV